MGLKPCPFCGGEAKYAETPIPKIICTKCEAQIIGYKIMQIPFYHEVYSDCLIQSLEKKWNRRECNG